MDILNGRDLRHQAADALRFGRSPRKLFFIHSLVIVLVQAVLVVLNYFLQEGIAGTGGLSGMTTRSVLTTAQTMLQFLSTVLTPFWQMGLLGVALMLARREYAATDDLFRGFRRFGPVLGLQLWRFFVVFAVLMICSQLASALFMMTPMSESFETALEPYLASGTLDYTALESMDINELLGIMKPMLYLLAALGIPAMAFVLYLLRFAPYAIMDGEGMRAFPAMIRSVRLSFRNLGKLIRLDLGFWWYYLLQALLLVLGYGDLILAYFVPALDANVLFYAAAAAQAVGTLLLAVTVQPRVEVTYAAAYRQIAGKIDNG